MAKEFQVGDNVYEFPDDYDDKKVKLILTGKGLLPGPGQSLPGVTPPTLPFNSGTNIMSMLGNALPMLGSMGGPAGTAAGTFAQNALPPEFGGLKEGEGFGKVAEDLGINLGVNHLIPAGAAALFKRIPGVAKLLQASQDAQNAKNLESQFLQGKAGTVPAPTSAQSSTTRMVSDPGSVSIPPRQIPMTETSTRVGASNPAAFANPATEELTKAINTGFSPTTGALDPVKILDNLAKNPKDYTNIDPMVRNNLKDFLTTVKDQKKFYEGGTKPIVSYYAKRLGITIASTAVGGPIAGGVVLLGPEAINQLVKVPALAKLATEAAKEMSGSKGLLLSKALLWGLRGLPVVYRAADGEEHPAQIGPDGTPQYQKSQ